MELTPMTILSASTTSANANARLKNTVLRAGTYVTGIPAPPCSGTAMLLSVNAEPPNTSSDTCSSRCASGTQRRRDAPRRGELRAMPLAVVERQRMALVAARARNRERRRRIEPAGEATPRSGSSSAPRHVAPEHFVQLHLQAHGQTVLEDPVGERAGRQLLVARREEHGARQRMLRDASRAHS